MPAERPHTIPTLIRPCWCGTPHASPTEGDFILEHDSAGQQIITPLGTPAFLLLHDADRHYPECTWSRPGAYNPATHPCICGLEDELRAIERTAREEPHDA